MDNDEKTERLVSELSKEDVPLQYAFLCKIVQSDLDFEALVEIADTLYQDEEGAYDRHEVALLLIVTFFLDRLTLKQCIEYSLATRFYSVVRGTHNRLKMWPVELLDFDVLCSFYKVTYDSTDNLVTELALKIDEEKLSYDRLLSHIKSKYRRKKEFASHLLLTKFCDKVHSEDILYILRTSVDSDVQNLARELLEHKESLPEKAFKPKAPRQTEKMRMKAFIKRHFKTIKQLWELAASEVKEDRILAYEILLEDFGNILPLEKLFQIWSRPPSDDIRELALEKMKEASRNQTTLEDIRQLYFISNYDAKPVILELYFHYYSNDLKLHYDREVNALYNKIYT